MTVCAYKKGTVGQRDKTDTQGEHPASKAERPAMDPSLTALRRTLGFQNM
jgi:hypothetical protein